RRRSRVVTGLGLFGACRAQLVLQPLTLVLQSLGRPVEPLAEVVTELVPRLGRKQQGQGAAHHRPESEGSDHGERGVVEAALLLQAYPAEQVVAFGKVGSQLLGEVLERHRQILRWSNAPRNAAARTLPAIARPPFMTSRRTRPGVSPPPST